MLAGTYAKGGEIFVLDMGDPVKIDDLARNIECEESMRKAFGVVQADA